MTYYVYIMASATNVTVYIGVTRNLIRRVYEHKNHLDPNSFTSQYNVHKLVYYEQTTDVNVALEREKQLKGWRRSKKNALIEKMNPKWQDLYPMILGEEDGFFDSAAHKSRYDCHRQSLVFMIRCAEHHAQNDKLGSIFENLNFVYSAWRLYINVSSITGG